MTHFKYNGQNFRIRFDKGIATSVHVKHGMSIGHNRESCVAVLEHEAAPKTWAMVAGAKVVRMHKDQPNFKVAREKAVVKLADSIGANGDESLRLAIYDAHFSKHKQQKEAA